MTAVAVTSAARSIFRSTSARNAISRFASQSKSSRLRFRGPARSTLPPALRYPVELSSSVESLLPYHTVTASALMTSMLSISRHSYGWLSDACNDDV